MPKIKITNHVYLADTEIKLTFIAAPGPGGQNVNKVATAVLLRFDVLASPSISDILRQRLLTNLQNKLTNQGQLLIKASRHRTQERNKQDALERFITLLQLGLQVPKKRYQTKPSRGVIARRVDSKKREAVKKARRRNEPC